jgi:tRNA pseudouridine32 synthase/23S rRNA pseudouridine746 synthase
LRVALKSVGAPILGDLRYGGSAADRGYLHDCGLRFEYGQAAFQFGRLPQQGSLFLDPAIREAIGAALDEWQGHPPSASTAVAVDAGPVDPAP